MDCHQRQHRVWRPHSMSNHSTESKMVSQSDHGTYDEPKWKGRIPDGARWNRYYGMYFRTLPNGIVVRWDDVDYIDGPSISIRTLLEDGSRAIIQLEQYSLESSTRELATKGWVLLNAVGEKYDVVVEPRPTEPRPTEPPPSPVNSLTRAISSLTLGGGDRDGVDHCECAQYFFVCKFQDTKNGRWCRHIKANVLAEKACCEICLEETGRDDMFFICETPGCNNPVCGNCYLSLLQKSTSCPFCRTTIGPTKCV